VLQKLGFNREWIDAGAFVKDGEPLDEALWSMTAERWKNTRRDSIARSASASRRTADFDSNRPAH
jgi:hypothetical protein